MVGQVFIQLSCDRPELCNGFDRAYLYAFRIRAPYRSKGIGSQMLAVVEEDLIGRGFRWLTLNVARDNPRAHQFYLRHGFRVVAPEPGCWSYIDDKGRLQQVVEPAWRMEKPL
jgi:ribosomal protein S18 acetylase RimI-like enzyme